MSYSYGCDVSKWNDDNNTVQQIDWKKNRNAGCDFSGVRGMFWMNDDEDFEYNWEYSQENYLLRMSYHFVHYNKSPKDQANAFGELLVADKGEIYPVCDFEYYSPFGDITYNAALNFLYDYFDVLDSGLATNTMLYSNPNWLLYKLRPTPAWLLAHPLWVAHWGVTKPITGDWSDWLFWQYTDREDGLKYGAESLMVDMNLFNGDTTELYRRFGDPNPPPVNDLDEINKRLDIHEKALIDLGNGYAELDDWASGYTE